MRWSKTMRTFGYEMASAECRLPVKYVEDKYSKKLIAQLKVAKMIEYDKKTDSYKITQKYMREFTKNMEKGDKEVKFHYQGHKHCQASFNFMKMLDKKTLQTVVTEKDVHKSHVAERKLVGYKNALQTEKDRVQQFLIDRKDILNDKLYQLSNERAKAVLAASPEQKKAVSQEYEQKRIALENAHADLVEKEEMRYKILFHTSTARHPENPSKEVQIAKDDRKPIVSSPDYRYEMGRNQIQMLVNQMERKIAEMSHERGRGNKQDYHRKLYEESRDKLLAMKETMAIGETVEIDVEIITSSYSAEARERHRNYERFTGRTLLMIPPK